MDFTTHKTKLEALGYVVESNIITTSRGDVMAAIDPYGDISCKYEDIKDILNGVAETPTVKVKAEEVEEVELVRARNNKGQLLADDPTTPEVNEAWVAKTKKKKK